MRGTLVVFGNTPELSFAELRVFYPTATRIAPDVGYIAEDFASGDTILRKLGGSVKIGQVLDEVAEVIPDTIAEMLMGLSKDGKCTFGISSYAEDVPITRTLLSQVKEKLSERGIHPRFIEAKDGHHVSSVVVRKQEMEELLVVPCGNNRVMIAHTTAIQDFEEWAMRDRGRPFADPRSGMLPPKVAKMAVNLGLGPTIEGKTLLDPFCGMGTILMEGLLTGCGAIGSDQDPQVVHNAIKNIEWLSTRHQYIHAMPVRVFESEATHLSDMVPAATIDAVITEPFMGDPRVASLVHSFQLSAERIKNIIKGLEKLYIGCLKDWKKVLKPGGKVVIALPEYAIDDKIYFVKKVIDNCETLGYTVLTGPIAYSRPQAVVRRKFFVFQKK